MMEELINCRSMVKEIQLEEGENQTQDDYAHAQRSSKYNFILLFLFSDTLLCYFVCQRCSSSTIWYTRKKASFE